jgi:hypothetical protein
MFDPSVFPPKAPETIGLTSRPPQITQGQPTIDASDAGVILDGSQLPKDTRISGLEIVSDGNTVRGLHIKDHPIRVRLIEHRLSSSAACLPRTVLASHCPCNVMH